MYVPLQMVRFWLCFGLKTVIDFAHFALELYTGLLGHYGSVRMCSLLHCYIVKLIRNLFGAVVTPVSQQ